MYLTPIQNSNKNNSTLQTIQIPSFTPNSPQNPQSTSLPSTHSPFTKTIKTPTTTSPPQINSYLNFPPKSFRSLRSHHPGSRATATAASRRQPLARRWHLLESIQGPAPGLRWWASTRAGEPAAAPELPTSRARRPQLADGRHRSRMPPPAGRICCDANVPAPRRRSWMLRGVGLGCSGLGCSAAQASVFSVLFFSF